MPKKYFFNLFIVLGTALLAGCSALIGAYSDNPYGPVVNCDSDLPTDELILCIKDQYELMDKIYMDPHQKFDRKWAKIYSQEKYQSSKDFYFPDTYQNVSYKTVPQFDSIKDCYKKDGCIVYEDSHLKKRLGRYDNYKRTVAVRRSHSIDGWEPNLCNDKECKADYSKIEIYFLLMDIVHRHFSRSYSSLNKDIILFEDPKLNLYTAHFEAVRLSDGKKLIGIRIIKFHSFDPVKDGFSLTGNVYEREIPGVRTEYLNKASAFKHFFPDSAFTVWDIRDDDIQSMADNFAISLDKRKNPSKIYINAGSKVYEIKIPKPEENQATNRKGD